MATASRLNPTFRPSPVLPTGLATAGSQARAPLDLGRISRTAVAIVALLLINKGGNIGAGIFFAILVGMVCHSPQQAFKALAICWLGLMLNYALVPKSLVWTPMRLALPLIAFVRFSLDLARVGQTLFAKPTYNCLLLYVLVMAACSALSGWYTQIALLKLINFWAVTSAIFAGVAVLRCMRVDVTEWIISLIAAATLVAILAILLGVHDDFRGARKAFVGAFLHPNCHSAYGALFVTMLASTFLLGDYPRRRIALPMIAMWIMFMIWSKARASIAGTFMGLIVLFIFAQPFRNRFGWQLRLNVSRSQIIVFMMAMAVLIGLADLTTQGAVSRSVIAFINKAGDESELTEIDTGQVLASRQGLIDLSMKNFREHPLTGIGFQVGTHESFIRNATWFTAPAEKGFLISAVLEEGGILGAIAWLIFLLALYGEFVASRNVAAVAIMTAFLTVNMAEVSIFSPGGSGAFGWMMVGAGMILGDHCWHKPQPQSGLVPR